MIDYSVASINYLLPSLWCPQKNVLADLLDKAELLSVVKVASFKMFTYQETFIASIQ